MGGNKIASVKWDNLGTEAKELWSNQRRKLAVIQGKGSKLMWTVDCG